jgi:hypothetical protein
MDYELWTATLIAIQHAAKRVGCHGGRRKPVYANWLIVATHLVGRARSPAVVGVSARQLRLCVPPAQAAVDQPVHASDQQR